MRDRSKLMAIAMVAMMLMSGVVMMTDGMDGAANNSEGFEEQELLLDGEEGLMLLGDTGPIGIPRSEMNIQSTVWQPNEGQYFSYTLEYDATKMTETAEQELQLNVDGMNPIKHVDNDGVFSALADEGSWGFDPVTGFGPFNSFYAAFNFSDNNKFVAVLNPYNLTETIDGTELATLGGIYNIMWVIPTTYWYVNEDNNLVVTNDPNAGGIAYAHTVDGIVHNYMAIGVYLINSTPVQIEGTTKYILTSQKGLNPNTDNITNLKSRIIDSMDTTLGTDAHVMIWNYYQWNLWKYFAYIVTEGFDAQKNVGNGIYNYVNNPNRIAGFCDLYGPYAGNPGEYNSDNGLLPSKLFIENPWGAYKCNIDGAMSSTSNEIYINTDHLPPNSTSTGTWETLSLANMNTSGWKNGIETSDARLWGMPNSNGGGISIGTTDYVSKPTGSSSTFQVGGYTGNSNEAQRGYLGLNGIYWNDSYTNGTTGSGRLSMVFDELPDATISAESNDIEYGTVTSTITGAIPFGTPVTTSSDGLTLTFGTYGSITASPVSGYRLQKWEPTPGVVTSDVTYTAVFEELQPVTVTLDAGKGTLTGETTITVIVGEPYGELPTPTPKGGYTFTGWYDPNGNRVTSETIVTETSDFTLTAHYELSDALKPVKALTDFIPILMIAGLIIAIIGTALYLRRDY